MNRMNMRCLNEKIGIPHEPETYERTEQETYQMQHKKRDDSYEKKRRREEGAACPEKPDPALPTC